MRNTYSVRANSEKRSHKASSVSRFQLLCAAGTVVRPKGNTKQGSGRLRALSHKTRNALAVKMESLTHTKSASQFAYYLQ